MGTFYKYCAACLLESRCVCASLIWVCVDWVKSHISICIWWTTTRWEVVYRSRLNESNNATKIQRTHVLAASGGSHAKAHIGCSAAPNDKKWRRNTKCNGGAADCGAWGVRDCGRQMSINMICRDFDICMRCTVRALHMPDDMTFLLNWLAIRARDEILEILAGWVLAHDE